MVPERGEYLIALETRLSTMARILSSSPTTIAGLTSRIEGDHARERRELVLADDATNHVGKRHRPQRLRLDAARLVIAEQVLDQLLQS